MAHVGPGDHETEGMDGISRVRHQDRIAVIDDRHGEMREPLFRADGDDGLGLGVQGDLVAARVPVTDGPAQPRDSARHRVAVGVLACRHLAELVDDVAGRGLVGVAHAEVDHVLAAMTCGHLELVDGAEDVRGQAVDAGEMGVQLGHERAGSVEAVGPAQCGPPEVKAAKLPARR